MKSIIKSMKWSMLLFGLITAVFGVCLVIWPTAAAMTFVQILGWIFVIAGVMTIINYFTNKKNGLATGITIFLGIVELVIGFSIVLNAAVFVAFIGYMFALVLLIHSVNDVVQAVSIKKMGFKGWVAPVVFSIIGILLAVLIMFNPFSAQSVLMVFIGIALIIDGVTDMIVALRVGAYTSRYVDARTIDPEKIVK